MRLESQRFEGEVGWQPPRRRRGRAETERAFALAALAQYRNPPAPVPAVEPPAPKIIRDAATIAVELIGEFLAIHGRGPGKLSDRIRAAARAGDMYARRILANNVLGAAA